MIKILPSTIGKDTDVAFDVPGLDVLGKDGTSEDAALRSRRRVRMAVEQHYELVWRSLRRLGVTERTVDDAAQQVLVILSRRIDDIREGSERAFMVSTAVRVAADFRKKQRRSLEVLDLDGIDERASPSLTADVLIDRARARHLLDIVLEEMPDELREVFVLFELEELTMAVIAETLGLPPGTVASRLRRARRMFEATAERLTQPAGGR